MECMMRSFFSGLVLLLAGSALISGPALAADDVTTYGDWGYKCDKSQDGTDQLCYVFQNVTKKDGGELVLGARIAYRPDQENPLIVATVPLGSLLPPGAALVMEGVEPIKLDYFLCAQQGCTTVATPLTPAMIEAMKKGEKAVIRVAAPNKQVVGLPLSLNGFTKALGSLK
jgi:invasion protein IalB